MSVKYDSFHAEKSFCKYCNKTVTGLLVDFDELTPANGADHPSFYICFDCKKIFQSGIGEVRIEEPSGKVYDEAGNLIDPNSKWTKLIQGEGETGIYFVTYYNVLDTKIVVSTGSCRDGEWRQGAYEKPIAWMKMPNIPTLDELGLTEEEIKKQYKWN